MLSIFHNSECSSLQQLQQLVCKSLKTLKTNCCTFFKSKWRFSAVCSSCAAVAAAVVTHSDGGLHGKLFKKKCSSAAVGGLSHCFYYAAVCSSYPHIYIYMLLGIYIYYLNH